MLHKAQLRSGSGHTRAAGSFVHSLPTILWVDGLFSAATSEYHSEATEERMPPLLVPSEPVRL